MEASDDMFAAAANAFETLKRFQHEQQWGTSSSAIGGGVQAVPKQITLER